MFKYLLIGIVLATGLGYAIYFALALILLFSAAPAEERYADLKTFNTKVQIVKPDSTLAKLGAKLGNFASDKRPASVGGATSLSDAETAAILNDNNLSTIEKMEKLSRGADAGRSDADIDLEPESLERWLDRSIGEE